MATYSNEQNGNYVRAQQAGNMLGNALSNIGNYSATAARNANAVSFASQNAQGAFNQASADLANAIGDSRTAQQYAYNSAGAAAQYAYNTDMWDKAAAWNEAMMQKQMDFNAKQAEINRKWQETMRATAYQTAVKDMETAGLNPILAIMNGGVGATGGMSGSVASASMPTMSSAAGGMTTGGLLNGLSASEGNFTGQMEYMGGMLGIISSVINGVSSAMKGLGSLGDFGEAFGNAIAEIFTLQKNKPDLEKAAEQFYKNITKTEDKGPFWNGVDYFGRYGAGKGSNGKYNVPKMWIG